MTPRQNIVPCRALSCNGDRIRSLWPAQVSVLPTMKYWNFLSEETIEYIFFLFRAAHHHPSEKPDTCDDAEGFQSPSSQRLQNQALFTVEHSFPMLFQSRPPSPLPHFFCINILLASRTLPLNISCLLFVCTEGYSSSFLIDAWFPRPV